MIRQTFAHVISSIFNYEPLLAAAADKFRADIDLSNPSLELRREFIFGAREPKKKKNYKRKLERENEK